MTGTTFPGLRKTWRGIGRGAVIFSICITVGGCDAAARVAFTGSSCSDLIADMKWGDAPPHYNRISTSFRRDNAALAGAPTVMVYHVGAPGAMLLTDHIGLEAGDIGKANFSLVYTKAFACPANSLVVRGKQIEGCRTEGCHLKARFTGTKLTFLELLVPAVVDSRGREALIQDQGACIVAATASAAGLWGAWTQFSRSDVEPNDPGVDNPPTYSVPRASHIWRCVRRKGE